MDLPLAMDRPNTEAVTPESITISFFAPRPTLPKMKIQSFVMQVTWPAGLPVSWWSATRATGVHSACLLGVFPWWAFFSRWPRLLANWRSRPPTNTISSNVMWHSIVLKPSNKALYPNKIIHENYPKTLRYTPRLPAPCGRTRRKAEGLTSRMASPRSSLGTRR